MGKLISIEGIDGSGKNTQTHLLVNNLRELGFSVATIAFPQYQSNFFGKEVGNYLNGKFGGLDEIHPKLAAMLYAGDRFESKSTILNLIEQNDFLICDRYTPSNIAHQSAKFSNEHEKLEFINWLSALEYEIYGLPKPTANIFLNVPPYFSDRLVELKEKRSYTNKTKDLHEENKEYLLNVYGQFLKLANTENNWYVIECVNDSQLRSVDSIASELLRIVQQL